MRSFHALIVCLSGLFLTGCHSTYKFRPYVGEQQEWPMSKGSIVDTDHPLPIYYGLPSKPYDVVGMMSANANSLYMASHNAQSHGGEAMILLDEKMVSGGSVSIPGGTTTHTTGNISGGNYYGNSSSYSLPTFNIPVVHTFDKFYVIKFKIQPSETASSATNSIVSTSKSTKTNP